MQGRGAAGRSRHGRERRAHANRCLALAEFAKTGLVFRQGVNAGRVSHEPPVSLWENAARYGDDLFGGKALICLQCRLVPSTAVKGVDRRYDRPSAQYSIVDSRAPLLQNTCPETCLGWWRDRRSTTFAPLKLNVIIRGTTPANLNHPLRFGESSVLRCVCRELMKHERERQDDLRR